jgi:hypothetical protein
MKRAFYVMCEEKKERKTTKSELFFLMGFLIREGEASQPQSASFQE